MNPIKIKYTDFLEQPKKPNTKCTERNVDELWFRSDFSFPLSYSWISGINVVITEPSTKSNDINESNRIANNSHRISSFWTQFICVCFVFPFLLLVFNSETFCHDAVLSEFDWRSVFVSSNSIHRPSNII